MRTPVYMRHELLILWMFYQAMLQQQLTNMQQQMIETQQKMIDMQQKVITLQQQIDEMRPKAISEQEVFWHLASNGVMSEDAAKSEDIRLVRKFHQWNVDFAKKHIKPYVNPQVYGEALNQMTRGLPTRMAELETKSSKRAPDREQAESKKTLKQKTLVLQ